MQSEWYEQPRHLYNEASGLMVWQPPRRRSDTGETFPGRSRHPMLSRSDAIVRLAPVLREHFWRAGWNLKVDIKMENIGGDMMGELPELITIKLPGPGRVVIRAEIAHRLLREYSQPRYAGSAFETTEMLCDVQAWAQYRWEIDPRRGLTPAIEERLKLFEAERRAELNTEAELINELTHLFTFLPPEFTPVSRVARIGKQLLGLLSC